MTLRLCKVWAKSLEKFSNKLTMKNVKLMFLLLIIFNFYLVIIKSSNGPRYIVGCRSRLNKKKLVQGTRVTLDMTTLTIMRILPREVDPLVYNMSTEDPGDISFEEVGGLGDQIRELREVIELPILNPELFKRIGVKAPKGVLLYGPPGTGKTLLARAVAASLDINFLKVVSSAIVDKYIGESARIIREMFGKFSLLSIFI